MSLDLIFKVIIEFAPVIIGAIVGYVIKYILDKRQQFLTKNAEFKRAAYQELIALMMRVMSGDKQKPFRNGELVKMLNDAYAQCILYASPQVINAFGDTMQYMFKNQGDEMDPKQAMIYITRIFKYMRDDIGLEGRTL